eukprot:532594-Prorocentrum_minimum.AAC.1
MQRALSDVLRRSEQRQWQPQTRRPVGAGGRACVDGVGVSADGIGVLGAYRAPREIFGRRTEFSGGKRAY